MQTFALKSTVAFDAWLRALREKRARARILARLDSARMGNIGDARSVGDGVRELRIHMGPGYRLYFAQRDGTLLLLCGGDKSTQPRDILKARRLLTDDEDC